MNGAHVGDLEHAVSLFLGKISLDRDDPVNLINKSLLVLATLAVFGVDSVVLQFDFDFINLQSLAFGIHPQSHRSASSQRGQ